MNAHTVVALLLLAGIAAGCSLGPSYSRPEIDTPAEFRHATMEPDSAVNLRWWELFDDPVLDTLVVAALEGNKDIGIALGRLEEARAFYGYTWPDQLPKLGVEAGATRGTYVQGLQLDAEANNFFISPVASWELDFWGKYRKASESARAEMMGAQYSLRSLQISLISEVVGAYLQLKDYRNRLAIADKTLALRKESLDIIQKRFDRGVIPEIDLFQAKAQREVAAQAIPLYRRLISRSENTIAILLGRLPSTFSLPMDAKTATIPEIPAGLPSELLERRPDLLAAEMTLKAQMARIGVAQALRLPSISLTGALGFVSSDLSQLTVSNPAWSVSAGLFGPIFNFGKNVARVEIEEARTQQALMAYEGAVLQAFREVEDALTDVETYREEFASKERELLASQNAARLSRSRYDKGVTSYLEVLESDRNLFNVELQHSDLLQQYLASYVRLYKALGGGWLTEQEEQAAEAPE